jgi:hypothetical protein
VLGHEMMENKTFIDEDGVQRQLTIQDIEPFCFLPQGTFIKCKVNCNSAFLLANPPPIATYIHQRLHWVPPKEQYTLSLAM